jgi:hypothetical protein
MEPPPQFRNKRPGKLATCHYLVPETHRPSRDGKPPAPTKTANVSTKNYIHTGFGLKRNHDLLSGMGNGTVGCSLPAKKDISATYCNGVSDELAAEIAA